jgi:threonine synthase|nr:pyridoxal-phosphate dependent enzyme [Candidatus Krumholzibacteria bacterium]
MTSPSPRLPDVDLNPRFAGYRCVLCGREENAAFAGNVCPSCGLEGIMDGVFDLEGLRRDITGVPAGLNFSPHGAGAMWRFAKLLPVVPTAHHPAWALGGTHLHQSPRLAEKLGIARLFLKDETGLPSASLKDRASAMAVAHARQLRRDILACASTGNAAASLALLTARAGLPCHIYVPASAPMGKLAQVVLHGAQVVRIDGTYDQAFELSLEQIARNDWYSRNCAHNPVLVEGKKTATLELIWDLTQGLADCQSSWPDAVLVPVGDGCIVSSVAKAFTEMAALGLTPPCPKIIGVQASGAAPLAQAWEQCPDPQQLDGPGILQAVAPLVPHTLADSIAVGIPRNRIKAWKYVAGSGGGFVQVDDDQIRQAIKDLAATAGVFAEPSAAAALAGIPTALARGLIQPEDTVAVMVTGHGLKDPLAALDPEDLPAPIPAS